MPGCKKDKRRERQNKSDEAGSTREELCADLRAELSALRTGSLRKQAVVLGAEEAQLADADDADDSKAAFMELIVLLRGPQGVAVATDGVSEESGMGVVESMEAATLQEGRSRKPTVFVDLDGTLVDFVGAVQRLGASPKDPSTMWDKIAKTPNFWSTLPWLDDGRELWRALLPLKPTVLTGLPIGNHLRRRAEKEKRAWCQEHLGADVVVLCVSASEKQRYSAPGHVLVDDNGELCEPWELQGGQFVLRRDARSTIMSLQEGMAAALVSPSESEAPTWKALYSGIFLSEASRSKMLERFPPRHGRVHADHVTLQVNPDMAHIQTLPMGEHVFLQVHEEISDARGHAASVRFANSALQDLCASGRPHITIATAVGVAPQYSLELLGREKADATSEGLQLEGVVGILVGQAGVSCTPQSACLLPSAQSEMIESFALTAAAGEQLVLGEMGSSLRKAVHEMATALGLVSSSGKKRNGKCQMLLTCTETSQATMRGAVKRRLTTYAELREVGFAVASAAVDALLLPSVCAAAEAQPGSDECLDEESKETDLEVTVGAEIATESCLCVGLARIEDCDLVSFLDNVLPSARQQQELDELATSICNTTTAACGGQFQALLVGSCGAGLGTASSDLDFALVPNDLESAESANGLRGSEHSAANDGTNKDDESSLLAKVAHVLRNDCGMRDVQVVVTRSKAPSLVKCVDPKTATQVDVVVRHGTGGAVASIDKAALLLHFCRLSSYFCPLVLLVKHWAKSRQLVAPTAGKLNSFSWTLMVAFFLQVNGLLAVLDCSPAGLRQRRRARDGKVSKAIASEVTGIASLLSGFFTYWRQFEYHATCASVRRGKCCNISDSSLDHGDAPQAFLLEDPVETDENTARTLSDRHLEEVRAELNRAHLLMQRGHFWDEICHAPISKKLKELKAFYLPERMLVPAAANSSFSLPDLITEAILPDEIKAAVHAFVENAACGSWQALPQPLSGGERRSLHHFANLCGIESKKVGKQSQGSKYVLQLRKPEGWEQKQSSCAGQPERWSSSHQGAMLQAMGCQPSLPPFTHVQGEAAVAGNSQFEPHSSLKVVSLLRSGMPLEKLQQKYKLIVKKHPYFPLLQLSYSQTESQMASPVVQECRGLILESGTWNVVALPFQKFFNYGERHAKPLDWASGVRVYEKLDGSLLGLYWYQGSWNVATSKLPAADGAFPDDSKRTFAEMFWQLWHEKGYSLPDNKDACFMFELTTPMHTIIVRHQIADLVCLGGRDLKTLVEIPCEHIAKVYRWPVPRRFDAYLTTLDEVVVATKSLNPVVQEGFVAVDQHWQRLKIKSASYVALHHIGGNTDRGGVSGLDSRGRRRSLLQIARSNEGDEFLAYYPDLQEEFHEVRCRLRALQSHLEHGSSGCMSVQVGRLSKKMRQDSLSVAEVLQQAKIQELEVAIDEVPLDASASFESGALLAVEAPAAFVAQALAAEECTVMDPSSASEMEAISKPANRFQGFLPDSPSESESD